MIETIMLIAATCGAFATIWALIEKITKPIKEITTKLSEINTKLTEFSLWQANQQADINISKEERRLICECLFTVFNHLIDKGANGDIHKAKDDLNKFLRENAHKGKSF
ncbi:hypothetical protein FACS1894132_13870 [Clostridia bacterium]|nr:hypothetical protein FACS1894132_13870 [Clostridia bacterium]